MRENFDVAFKHVLKSEGGFTNDPVDPGGMTNLGITLAEWQHYVGHIVNEKEMRSLTPEKVKPLYKYKYWNAVAGDDLPKGIDYLLFDFGVNAGPGRAVKIMQECVGAKKDGVIGPRTISAIKAIDAVQLIDEYTVAKKEYYKSLSTFWKFGKGWFNRCDEVATIAKGMI